MSTGVYQEALRTITGNENIFLQLVIELSSRVGLGTNWQRKIVKWCRTQYIIIIVANSINKYSESRFFSK